MSLGAIVVAAGRGERAGQSQDGPKQYRSIGGRPVIAETIRQLFGHADISSVIAVIHRSDAERFAEALGSMADRVETVFGGETRQHSVAAGLERAGRMQAPPTHVLIHDAVRPFTDEALLTRVIRPFRDGWEGGVIPALPVRDTLKAVSAAGEVENTLPRPGLFAAQTPQAFPLDPIRDAHRRAGAASAGFTDDAAVAEWAGMKVRIVAGSPENVKLTFAEDLVMADRRIRAADPVFPDVRTGNGYDVHVVVPGPHVILCGVPIPGEIALSGHSDADVGWHALTDALLATCGAGDIGTHFPPEDQKWKGAPSRVFLRHAADLVRSHGGRVAHTDVTLICEAPKISPHREEMRAATADILRVDASRVSVKATTNEKLGFLGRGEGIAAIATATVVYEGSLP